MAESPLDQHRYTEEELLYPPEQTSDSPIMVAYPAGRAAGPFIRPSTISAPQGNFLHVYAWPDRRADAAAAVRQNIATQQRAVRRGHI